MRCLFIGNRFSVLAAMLERGLDMAIVIPCGAYAQAELEARGLRFRIVSDKADALAAIRETAFDLLVSNGCPYILPVSALAKHGQRFINVHPSYLPDLKGIHPINGALLYQRMAGAACHVMDDSIDGGPLIARRAIPLTPEMDLAELYRLSFAAERTVFETAWARDFMPDPALAEPLNDTVYYTRKDGDWQLDFTENTALFLCRVRAFGIPSQGARFEHNGGIFKVMRATRVPLAEPVANGTILQVADNSIVVAKHGEALQLSGMIGDMALLKPGDRLA